MMMRGIRTGRGIMVVAFRHAAVMIAPHEFPDFSRILDHGRAAQFPVERRHVDHHPFRVALVAEFAPGEIARRILPRHARFVAFATFVITKGEILAALTKDTLIAKWPVHQRETR